MRFLHISDLHFCLEKDGRDSRNMRSKLIEYIRRNKLTADKLFITGDYRHACLQEKDTEQNIAQNAANLIREIANAAGITDVEHIHLVLGNRYLSRGVRKTEREQNRLLVNTIRKNYNSLAGCFSDDEVLFSILH